MPEPNEPREPDASVSPAGGGEETAAATRSLTEALRVSFHLLAVVMVGTILFWLIVTGMSCVEPTQRAVRMVFGAIQGRGAERVFGEGLVWSWPEPFGRVLRVSVAQQTLELNDFWMYERPEEKAVRLSERRPSARGLRPGWDGALLTGDRNLVHARIVCKYRTGVRGESPDPDAVIDYLSHIRDTHDEKLTATREMVRSAVCAAAIRVAAGRTLESIYPSGQESFAKAVRKYAQRRLDELNSGIHIDRIEVPSLTVPLAAIPAFNAESKARQDMRAQHEEARIAATKVLYGAAGDSWQLLAGQLERPEELETTASQRATALEASRSRWVDVFRRWVKAQGAQKDALAAEIRRFGLLNLYAEAREMGNERLAGQVLAEIGRVITSSRTGGTAARIINRARTYSERVRNNAQARAERFQKLLKEYRAAPDLFIKRLWTEVQREILTNPLTSKVLLPKAGKYVIRFSEPAKVRRDIQREMLKAKEKGQEGGSGSSGQ